MSTLPEVQVVHGNYYYLPSSYQINIPVIFKSIYYKVAKVMLQNEQSMYLQIRKQPNKKNYFEIFQAHNYVFRFFFQIEAKTISLFFVFIFALTKNDIQENPNGKTKSLIQIVYNIKINPFP